MEETKHIPIPQVIKSYPILAAAASFWQPGLGQILCGKIKRGILVLVLSWLTNISNSILNWVYAMRWLSYQLWYQFFYPISMVMSFITLFIRIWAVYDAYRIASNLKTAE